MARVSYSACRAVSIPVAFLLVACSTTSAHNPGFDAKVLPNSDHALTFSSSGGGGSLTEPVAGLMPTQVVLDVGINGGTVRLDDANGREVTALRAAHDYQGETLILRPLDVASVEVSPDTSDPWSVSKRSLTANDVMTVPGVVAGSGDDVLYVDGVSGDADVSVDATCEDDRFVNVTAVPADGSRMQGHHLDPAQSDLPRHITVESWTAVLAVEGQGCSWTINWH